ncbi:MAG TPA: hypothetical protein VK928_13115 [Longimicrobiales bacterium]|nr:hypothetical protein [Longimicrobiales bacterium]
MRGWCVPALRAILPALLAVTPAVAMGQPLAAPATAPLRSVTAESALPSSPAAGQDPSAIGPDFLLSALLPGAAQYRAGDGRWVPYMAVEAWSWLSFIQHQRNGQRLARRYRDVAWRVARRVSAGEVRRDTVFAYYEAMADARYPASGAFDADPDVPGVQPERSPNTFNGDIWNLAQRLYLGGRPPVPGSPGYEAALAYYQRRAIPDGFAWAWGVSTLEQRAYRNLIADSDEAYAAARQHLGLILANHITSTVDALVTARLRQLGANGMELRTTPGRDARGLNIESSLRITF